MNMTQLNDPLNLRDFISAVTDFIGKNGSADAQPKTMINFLSILMTGNISNPSRKDAVVTLLQKLFCGNIPYSTGKIRALSNDICASNRDAQLLKNLKKIAASISRCSGADSFYSDLMGMVSLRYFDSETVRAMAEHLQKKQYPRFLLVILKHGFDTLYNLPVFFGERLYDEGLTYEYDSPHRIAVMKIAADNGNRNAALEYGSYLAKNADRNAEECINYFMTALPLPAAAWWIAYLFEKGRTDDLGLFARFRSAFRIEEKIKSIPSSGELEKIAYNGGDPRMGECMIYIYKVYFVLAYHGFFKAFNSMANMLNGIIRFNTADGETRAADLRRKYWNAAIKGSNIPACLNEGNRIRLERQEKDLFDPASDEERYMAELLELASETGYMRGSFYLGEYHRSALKHGQDAALENAECRRYYKKAQDQDTDGKGLGGLLWMRMSEVAEDSQQRRKYLEQALDAGQRDAAFLLAEMDLNGYDASDQKTAMYLFRASGKLRDHMAYFSDTYRARAETMYRFLESQIGGKEGAGRDQ